MALQDPVVHPDVLTLAALLRDDWPAVRDRIRRSGHPTCDGDADAGDEDASATADDDAGDTDEDDSTSDDDTADEDAGAGDDLSAWKRQARRHEREKKAALRREADLKKRLQTIEQSSLSDKEKELAAARAEARTEALSEAEKDRRADKLELAVTKIALTTGVSVGEGDKARTVKFADADDVQMWLERQIDNGDIDADAIYKDGRVDTDVLTDALSELAAAKPTWLAGTTTAAAAAGKPAGDADAGKGKPPKDGGSVDDHFNKVRRNQPATT